jgi:hypothetical protein
MSEFETVLHINRLLDLGFPSIDLVPEAKEKGKKVKLQKEQTRSTHTRKKTI